MVEPRTDAVNSRWFYFDSASRPFGMVNLNPDTEVDGAWGSGYRYDTDTIKGFNHIHAWQLAGPSVMPIVIESNNINSFYNDFYSNFDHETEVIYPGYHQVYLKRYQIKTELTSTKRVGFHKYTYEGSKNAAVLFNLNGQQGPSLMKDGNIDPQTDHHLITGRVTNSPTMRRPKDCKVFFAVQFNQPIKEIKKDLKTGNYIALFDTVNNNQLLMKVAISYTSAENAKLNLKEELPEWNFEEIVQESQKEWNSLLSRIEVEGGTTEQQKRFYTDLWHSLQGRRIISDVNGAYPDNTGKEFRVGQLPLDKEGKPKFNHYNSDAFWGAQWTINTLWGLVYPEVMEEFVNSLMQYYSDGGLVPRGPSGGNYTYVMTGASSTPFIVSAIQKGIVKGSLEFIYQALKKNHMPGGIMCKAGYEHATALGGGFEHYLKNGYVPYPIPEGKFGAHQDGAGLTLEYAYQDWTLAQLAKKLGHKEDEQYFMERAKNYVNVFNTDEGWMCPKDIDGNWKADFDPYQLEHGFNESNGAQATWFVPHDLSGLAQLMGGNMEASNKLNASFEQAQKMGFTAGTSHDREMHPEYSRIPINYGNQPSIQTAFVFNHFNQPWLTQKWSRKVTETVYQGLSEKLGYNGDEDQGLMGALAVLMKMGLFSMDGGCSAHPTLELGSPMFNKVIIQLNPKYYKGGKEFIIEAVNNSPNNCYIDSASWNSTEYRNWQISHEKVINGGKLKLWMSDKPNKQYGISTIN